MNQSFLQFLAEHNFSLDDMERLMNRFGELDPLVTLDQEALSNITLEVAQ